MRRLLRSLGYAAVVFPSASEFLVSPELATTACLVADVQMPRITGIELCAHLVAMGRTIPTILVTAYPDDDVYKRALSLGVECYLCKPLEGTELISCLRCAFARGRSAGGAP
jgi:FixJ family two-component response regulator